MAVAQAPPTASGRRVHGRPRGSGGAFVAAAAVVGALSLLLPSVPTYDPWAWLIWSREIVHLDLVTAGGPSWKPLPVLIGIPFALTGDGTAPALWLAVARAGGALALLMAFRLGWRLSGRGIAGWAAGAVAALGILGMSGWLQSVAFGSSEGLLIALVLAAFDRHLDGHRGQAFLLGVGAALLRPEVWPFLAVYGVVLGLRDPCRRVQVVAAGIVVLALWFLPEWWGSGHLLRSAERANDPLHSSIAFARHPALEVLRSTGALLIAPLYAGAIVALAVAAAAFGRRRGDGAVLAVGLAAAGWTVLIMVMTEAGYSGNPRYLMLAAALASVLGGVGFARLGQAAAGAVARRRVAAGAVVVVAALALSWPWAAPRARALAAVERSLAPEAGARDQLEQLVRRLGGPAAVLDCGTPATGRFQRPIVAWTLGVHARRVAFRLDAPVPGLVFRRLTQRPLDPALPEASPPYHTVAALGRWQVLAVGCTHGDTAAARLISPGR